MLQYVDFMPFSSIQAVRLKVLRLNLEYHESCAYDSLDIRKRSVVLASLCGDESGDVYKILGPEVILHFHTDNSGRRRGFDMEYRFIQVDEGTSSGPFFWVYDLVPDPDQTMLRRYFAEI